MDEKEWIGEKENCGAAMCYKEWMGEQERNGVKEYGLSHVYDFNVDVQ